VGELHRVEADNFRIAIFISFLPENEFMGNLLDFWLAVHGKAVLFWKEMSGLKFPCIIFY